ncbi:CAP domain-containing protein [Uliginosibacterium paludis]|uniref:CAP domain-containing protein n=1 Tax=Uliginosibacterium paludis TaxID=1615952 RepID=A0ABV2CLQ5_9RHOO
MQSTRHSLPSFIIVQLLALALAACGGGGSGGSEGTSTTNQSASSVATSNAASSSSRTGSNSSASSSKSSTGSTTSSSAGSVSGVSYTVSPQVSNCVAGQVSTADKNAVLARINEIRSRHGLPAVTYDSSDDAAAAAAALYMVANGELTHTPDSSGSCYTSEAARLAGKSNLYMAGGSNTRNMASADSVTAYLVDSNVSTLGHRRWVLYPFLASTSFGRVDSDDGKSMASALRTIGGAASSVSMTNDFVAYPYGSYPSSDFSTSWYLSFSAIASKTSAYANGNSQVSFSGATITVTNASGQSLTVSDRIENYEGYGLANSLQWKVAGLASGGSYTVTINGVTVNGASRNYSYGFQLQ